MGVYFYNIEEDCQDRELEMNVEPIHMMNVEEWESWLIDNNICMNVNVSILKRFNTIKTDLEQTPLASDSASEPAFIDSRQNGASLVKVFNMSNRVNEPVSSQQEAPKKPSSRDVLRALALQESKKSPLIKKGAVLDN